MGDERATRTTLRAWRAGEVAAVLRLWKAANATPSATDNVEAVQRLVDSDAGILLVAEAGGRLVGTSSLDGMAGAGTSIARRYCWAGDSEASGPTRYAQPASGFARGVPAASRSAERHHRQATAFWDSLREDSYEPDARMARYVKTL
jgi:hypothetical protein